MLIASVLWGVATPTHPALASRPRAGESASGDDQPAVKAKVRELIAAADKAFSEARYAEAAKSYVDAHALLEASNLVARPELLFNAGLAYERIDACDRVAQLFARYLADKPEAATADLEYRLKRARDCAPEVEVRSTPPGALLSIDSEARGATPARLNIRAGAHVLRLTLEGYLPLDVPFSVEPRRPLALNHDLVPVARAGHLAIDAPPGTVVSIDGVRVAGGPPPGAREIAPGTHQVSISRPGCTPREVQVDVTAGVEPTMLDANLDCPAATASVARPPPSGAPGPPGAAIGVLPPAGVGVWAAAAVGAAGALTGTTLAILSHAAVNRRDAEIAKGEQAASDRYVRQQQNKARGLAIGADVAFGVAAAGLIAAGVLYLMDLPDNPADLSSETLTGSAAFRW